MQMHILTYIQILLFTHANSIYFVVCLCVCDCKQLGSLHGNCELYSAFICLCICMYVYVYKCLYYCAAIFSSMCFHLYRCFYWQKGLFRFIFFSFHSFQLHWIFFCLLNGFCLLYWIKILFILFSLFFLLLCVLCFKLSANKIKWHYKINKIFAFTKSQVKLLFIFPMFIFKKFIFIILFKFAK